MAARAALRARARRARRAARRPVRGVLARSSRAAIPHAHGPDLFIDTHERLGDVPARRARRARWGRVPGRGRRRLRRAPPSRAVTLDGARYAVPLSSKCVALYVNDALVAGDARDDRAHRGAREGRSPPDAYPLVYEADDRVLPRGRSSHALRRASCSTRADTFGFVGAQRERPIARRSCAQLVTNHVVPEEPSGALVTQLFASGRARDGDRRAHGSSGDLEDECALPRRAAPYDRGAPSAARMRPLLTVEAVLL